MKALLTFALLALTVTGCHMKADGNFEGGVERPQFSVGAE